MPIPLVTPLPYLGVAATPCHYNATYIGPTFQWLLDPIHPKETTRKTWPGEDQATRLTGIRDQRGVLLAAGCTRSRHWSTSGLQSPSAQGSHSEKKRNRDKARMREKECNEWVRVRKRKNERKRERERGKWEREMIERKTEREARERENTLCIVYCKHCSEFHKPVIFNPLISSNPLLNENLKWHQIIRTV